MPTRGWILTGIVLDPTQSVDVSEYVFDPEDGDATHEFGFTLGGPLWRDRAWFFGGFLSEVRNRTRSVTFTSGEAGRFQRKDRLRSSPVKIDFQPAEQVRLTTLRRPYEVAVDLSLYALMSTCFEGAGQADGGALAPPIGPGGAT